MYVRIRRHKTGWDDYTICIALALSLLGTVANVYQVANGTGRHIETLTPEQLSEFIKWTFVEGVAFVISTCFVKLSVCTFILRLIDNTRRIMHYFVYVLMGFLIVSTLGLVIALLAQCRPLKALYVLDLKGKCYSKNVSTAVAYCQAGKFPSPCTASFSALRIGFLHTNLSTDVTYDDAANIVFAV
ncbi:MAG: hypothetical protein Q9193_005560 [Seirophora villosa]